MVVECVNNMQRPIKGIFADFVKEITVTAQGQTRTLSDKNTGTSGGTVAKGGSAFGCNAKRISVNTNMTVKTSSDGTNYQTSCNGGLIQCQYSIQARFVPDICCVCNREPTVKFPVNMTIPNVSDQFPQSKM